MANLVDLNAMYESVQTGWSRIRADVFSHVLVFFIIFIGIGAALPEFQPPELTPSRIRTSDYYELVKDFGGILLIAFLLTLALVAYGIVLRGVGRFLTTLEVILLAPAARDLAITDEVTEYSLATVALTLDKRDFSLGNVYGALTKLLIRYRTKFKDEFEEIRRTPHTNDSVVYVRNINAFLAAWWLLFALDTSWSRENPEHFWPVTFCLLALLGWHWFRYRISMVSAQSRIILFVATKINEDPELAPVVERNKLAQPDVHARVRKLIENQTVLSSLKPSLLRFIGSKFQKQMEAPRRADAIRRLHRRRITMWYVSGRQFAHSPLEHRKYDRNWLRKYLAYLLYRFVEHVKKRIALIRHAVLYGDLSP